jgi:hypothetical protein
LGHDPPLPVNNDDRLFESADELLLASGFVIGKPVWRHRLLHELLGILKILTNQPGTVREKIPRRPLQPHQIGKFDKGLHPNDPGQNLTRRMLKNLPISLV